MNEVLIGPITRSFQEVVSPNARLNLASREAHFRPEVGFFVP